MVDPSSPAHQLVGAVLNARWKLVRLVGEGGMGAVYEAEGLRGEGKRAIKMLHPEFAEDEQILQRFYMEGQATASLQHPNVAAVYEAARAENGAPYLVMELLQGASLGDYLENGNVVPPEQAIPVIYEVLQALAMAHARKIVHRDLKPDNVFLVRDARGAYHAKVLDFGIAKVMDLAGGMGSKTRTGVLLGTPGYMSPEQIKNSKGVDPRSDLWSVGIILYEMLSGQPPFPADNEFTRLTAVLTSEVRPIEQAAPHLAAWSPFFRRALAKDPAQRFQTAEEMAHALGAYARGASMAPPAAPEHSVSIPVSIQHGPSTLPNAPQHVASMLPGYPQGVAVHQDRMSATPVPGQPQHPSTAVSGAAPLYAPSPAGPTHISAQKPAGTPTISSPTPDVQVIQAGSGSKGAPWWLVSVIGFVCLGVGFAVGMLVAG
ncbi:MAG: protein kinase [Polyangiaceae bacterium]|nr:protein kinase [Polyangiaceae bacterium]